MEIFHLLITLKIFIRQSFSEIWPLCFQFHLIFYHLMSLFVEKLHWWWQNIVKILFSEEVLLLRKFNVMFGPTLMKKLFNSLHISFLSQRTRSLSVISLFIECFWLLFLSIIWLISCHCIEKKFSTIYHRSVIALLGGLLYTSQTLGIFFVVVNQN